MPNEQGIFLSIFFALCQINKYNLYSSGGSGVGYRREDRRSVSKGPQGQRRPADAVGCAVTVARIATGEAEETLGKVPGRRKAVERVLLRAPQR